MINKLKFKQEDINNEYKKIGAKEKDPNFEQMKFDDQHERFGYFYMVYKLGYEVLVDNEGDIHGFDGILTKTMKTYFHEAKFLTAGSFSTLFDKAMNTNIEPTRTRISGLKNAKTIIALNSKILDLKKEPNKTYKTELELINKYLGDIRDKRVTSIPYDRMLFTLGSKKSFSKTRPNTKAKLESIKETLVIEYE